MALPVQIILDQKSIKAYRKALARWPGDIDKALKESINRAASKARTQIVQTLHGLYGLKKKDIRKNIRLQKATNKFLQAQIDAFDRKIPLFKLGGKKGRAKKVSFVTDGNQAAWLFANIFTKKYDDQAIPLPRYTIKRKVFNQGTYKESGQVKTIPDKAFFATMKSGHKGFFERVAGTNRQIRELRGPSVGEQLGGFVVKKIEADALKNVASDLDARVARFLKARRGAA